MMTKTLQRATITLVLVLAFASLAQGHITRLLVTRPISQPGGKTTVYIGWGHLLPVDELVSAEDMKDYRVHTPSGSIVTLELSGRSLQAQEITLEEPGLYQVEISRKPTIFTRYTTAEGKPVFALAPKNEVEIPEGAKIEISAKSEQYAKALILCGSETSTDSPSALGQPLEIVPLTSPGPKGFSPDEPVRVQVLYDGKPLAGATVYAACTTLNPDGIGELSAETDDQGQVSLELYEPGTWLLETSHRTDAPASLRESFNNLSYLHSFSIPVADLP